MASYKFISGAGYFEVDNGVNKQWTRINGLILNRFSDDNRKVFIAEQIDYTVSTKAIPVGIEIDLDVDSVDVDGITVFADADALITALIPIFYAEVTSDIQTLGYTAPNITLTNGGSVDVGQFTPSTWEIVNQSNFATKLSSITSTKVYYIDGQVDVGSFQIEVPATGFRAFSSDFDTSAIISDGNQPLFISPITGSGNIFLRDLSIVGAEVFDLTDATGDNAIEILSVNFIGCNLGNVTDYRQIFESGTGRFGGSPEITLNGTMNGYRVSTSIVRGVTIPTALFKTGTGLTFDGRFITDINADLGATGALFDFSPANIVNDESLKVEGAFVLRNGVINASDTTLYPNIDHTSVKSRWSNNVGMPDTRKYIKGMVTTEVTTVINSVLVYEVLQGLVTIDRQSHFEQVGTGFDFRLLSGNGTYNFTGNLSIEGNSNVEYSIRVTQSSDGIVWTEINHIKRVINSFVGGRDVGFTPIAFIAELRAGDRVRLEIENYTNSSNFTAEEDSYMIISQ